MQNIGLTREQKTVLHLAARNISADPSSLVLPETELKDVDWNAVWALSNVQAIPLATFDAAAPYKALIPSEAYDRYKSTAMSVLQSNFSVAQWQADLVELLNAGSFPYIILKGQAASAYYPAPELRALGDVDFLIDPKQQTEIENVLMEQGYQKSHGDHPNHVVFRKGKAHLEMHFEVAGVPYGWQGEAVREFLQNAVFEPQIKAHETGAFYAPTDLYHGLILLLHMQHHMLGEGLGIRHLCDWATYVAATCGQAFWEETLLPLLKKIGLLVYAQVMTKTCAIYLQIPCPEWAKKADEKVCAEVIEDVLACGNFGRNDIQRSKGGMLVSEHGKGGTKHGRMYHLFKILHGETWGKKAVKKFVLLYPFVFGWQILWHVWRTVTGKSKPLKVFNEAEKRKIIYDKLKVFEAKNKEK